MALVRRVSWPAAIGWLIVTLAAGYLAARTALVPLTYDEAASFARYVADEPAALFDFASATNHLLNSVLSRLAVAVLGSSPFALRLPSLLAGFAYLGVVVALARRARHSVIGLAGLVMLAANPYLMDYLSLSRGYGLAVAFISASVFLMTRWFGQPLSATESSRPIAPILALAGAAVAANFAMLPTFLAVTAVVIARIVWTAWTAPPFANTDGQPLPWWRFGAAWLFVAALFTAAVFARERVLSDETFLPITMRVAGLFEDELAGIRVFRTEDTGRLRELPRRDGGTWQTGPVHDAWRLHVVLPAAVDRNLASLDLTMGARTARRDRQSPGPWREYDVDGDRVLESTDRVRWAGDRRHRQQVATHTVAVLGALAAFGAALIVASRALVRRRLITPAQARPVVAALLAVASLAAAPLYLLQRDGQLFFGGTTGLVHDTIGSLVAGALYRAGDPPALMPLVLTLALIPVVLVRLILWQRPNARAAFVPAGAVSAVIGLTLFQAEMQHHLFGTPYPQARTAIYLLPLALVLLLLMADAIASVGRVARALVTTAMVLLAAGAAWNGARAANVSQVLDWREDRATPEMLAAVATSSPQPGVVRIGVDWMYYPVARYYAERLAPNRYKVIVLPGDGLPFDFTYAWPDSEIAQGPVVRSFPVSGAVLRRGR